MLCSSGLGFSGLGLSGPRICWGLRLVFLRYDVRVRGCVKTLGRGDGSG